MKLQIPLLKKQSTVVFIDDASDFLSSIELFFGDKFRIKTFTNPVEALEFINKNTEELVSVVVTDYSMPQMNGVDLSSHIEDKALNTILLTGEATLNIVVDGFNKGLISKYIQKSDADFIDKLEIEIARLEDQYFIAMSDRRQIIPTLESFFESEEISKQFKAICTELGVEEYLMIKNPARFSMVNTAGDRFYMLLMSDYMLKRHLIAMKEEHAPAEMVAAITSRKRIPWFLSDDGLYCSNLPPSLCKLYPAQQFIDGDKIYYFTVTHAEHENRVIASSSTDNLLLH